ncbi:hypothetical protein [Amycolatopsis sp. CA-230715]|uniref:hypothetical protein n=1 Tax=Amycolatopsis sp. CA-230715 TaxID=2745196 RepID=UPI001C0291A2|nr:hypothetical protein [Amycolatopsis sp. CA-230715]QWF85747.1 hypothetical protein HUW46_09227 [Amycolatopsis sp. CA-230715]
MIYPTVALTGLSPDAQRLYHLGTAGYWNQLWLNRNWFDRKQVRLSASQLNPNFKPRRRLLNAIAELTAADYALPQDDGSFWMIRVEPDVYTIAHGDDFWDIVVSRVLFPDIVSPTKTFLAVLSGARIVTQFDENRMVLNVYVPGTGNEVHGPRCAASITIRLPTFPRFEGNELLLWGITETVHLYPLGTDPTLVDVRDHNSTLTEPVLCDNVHCVTKPHILAPWMPPRRDLAPQMVRVEIHQHHDKGIVSRAPDEEQAAAEGE